MSRVGVGPHMVTHLGKFMSRLSLSPDRCPNQVLVGLSRNGRNRGVETASARRDVRTLAFSLYSLCPFFLSADAHYNLHLDRRNTKGDLIFLLWLLLASNSF